MVSTFFSYLHGTAFPLLPRPSSLARALFLHRGRCALTGLPWENRQSMPALSFGTSATSFALLPTGLTYLSHTQTFLNYRFLGVLPPSLVRAPSSIKFSRTQACPVHCSQRKAPNQRSSATPPSELLISPASQSLSKCLSNSFPSFLQAPTAGTHTLYHRRGTSAIAFSWSVTLP